MEMIQSPWVMINISAKNGGLRELWLGWVRSCDGDGCLAVMEHEAGIEQVTGHRLESGHDYRSGHEFGLEY